MKVTRGHVAVALTMLAIAGSVNLLRVAEESRPAPVANETVHIAAEPVQPVYLGDPMAIPDPRDYVTPQAPAAPTRRALASLAMQPLAAVAPVCQKELVLDDVPAGATGVRVSSDGIAVTPTSIVKTDRRWTVIVPAKCTRSTREAAVEFIGSDCPCGTDARGKALRCPCFAGIATMSVATR